jgi:hypothetical protein
MALFIGDGPRTSNCAAASIDFYVGGQMAGVRAAELGDWLGRADMRRWPS